MAANDHTLLNLRGSFQDPIQSISPLPGFYSIEEVNNLFPVTDEHAVVVSQKSVHLLHLPSQEILWNIFTADPIVASALAPDQSQLALAFAETTVLWDVTSGQIIRRFACSLSEGGELVFGSSEVLAVAPMNGGVQLWNVKEGQLLYTLVDEEKWYYQSPKSMAFSPDGIFLAVGHADGPNVWLWRVADGHLHRMMDVHPWSQRIWGLAFSPDGKLLIGSEWSTDPEEESMSIWEVSTGKRIDKLPHMAWLPATSPDGQCVASTSSGSLFVWNLANKRLLWQPMEEREDVVRLLFNLSGRFLISCSSNGTVRWWDIQQQQETYRLECSRSGQISGALSREGQKLVTRTVDGNVQMWDTTNGTVSFHVPFSNALIEGSALGSIGKRIVLWQTQLHTGLPTLYLIDPFFRGYLNFVPTGKQKVECAAYNEGSKWLAAGCTDLRTAEASIFLWHITLDLPITVVTQDVQKTLREQLEPIHRFVGHQGKIHCMMFSPNGELLASGADDNTIRLWNIGTKEVGPILHGHTQVVVCLAFSPSGNWLISGSKDGTVCMWDVASGQLLHVMEGQMGSLVSVAVSEDEQRITAVDQDQRIRVWQSHGKAFRSESEPNLLRLITHKASSLKGELISPEQLQEGIHFWTFASGGSSYQLMQENTKLLAATFQADNSLLITGYCRGATAIWDLTQISVEV